jgi:integrase
MARRRKQPGTGCVLDRPSSEHGCVYQIRWRVNGGPARYETIGPDRQEAEDALALRLAEINRGTYRERRTATVHEFASDWFAGHRSRLRPSTVDRVRNDLEVHLIPFFGEYLLDQVSAELIERYVAEKVEERRRGEERIAELERELVVVQESGLPVAAKRRELRNARRERGLSSVSINKTLTLLRQVLAAAVRYDYIDRNPVDEIRRLKVRRKTKPFLQLDQAGALIEATDERYRPLLLTLLMAGLRIGEALALRWSDVELLADPPRLNVSRTWDPASKPEGAGRRGVEGPVKTGEAGSVTIGRRLLEALLDHKARSSFGGDGDLVFPTSKGGHENPSNVRRRVLAPAIVRANGRLALEDRPLIQAGLTPHALRHTYCSLLIAQGEDLPTVAAQMRHADLSTTLRVYTHVMKHRREGVAERLDAALWGDSNTVSGRKEVASGPESPAADAGGQRRFRSSKRFLGARPAGFEPATSASGGQRSIH